ncbi:hypothetical protein OIDMADRAFT_199704 [Oidiodendron maius Zn]|uniref:Uncharacterized protein n=1 Tax=Oidiodendron maius (strain Zn) TaxID=913774 RepID=A0A0C3CMU8_OIDMZ|nr:hypothetical protein OIDMADRAFT_199704 [Oidiodendron maius Zn]
MKQLPGVSDAVLAFLQGDFRAVLQNPTSQDLFERLSQTILHSREQQQAALQELRFDSDEGSILVLITGLAAISAFLQANVTGPTLSLGSIFSEKFNTPLFKEKCLKSLDVDGVSLDHDILRPQTTFSTEARVQFLLEKAQIYIMQGLELKARENVNLASTVCGFNYALAGALGKKTKFQQTDISQLVVFAKSKEDGNGNDAIYRTLSADIDKSNVSNNNHKSEVPSMNAPAALNLDDDTLLESIQFAKSPPGKVDNSALPPQLVGLLPDDQPQLNPLDQITLLTEATLKDTLLPLDKLSSEEILPYAVRVLTDKPSNWQIYTQALLVRSRIESHRSRTQERSVLQLQVIVDQIIVDTQDSIEPKDGIPEIKVTQFLPRVKPSESAPATERLKYIYPLNTPTRWELETELAYAWSNAGSLISALEIFKRLHLWAEVALCFHSVGQEDKARQVVRRQLYHSSKGKEMDKYDIDANEIISEEWNGDIRSPSPPHSPRLWCILGDLEQDPACWERAWEISNHRYARAQRTLGEYYTRQGDLEKAREAYMNATAVNRQNNDTWARLGDIDLRIGNWDGAIIAFQQSIMIDDTDAKTYSNLGSALLSKHTEMVSLQKSDVHDNQPHSEINNEDDVDYSPSAPKGPSPNEILQQALKAYKRGATLAHENWKIWDNVITIAGRMSPPAFPEILMGMRAVLRIRGPNIGENAVDIDILRALISEVTSRERPANNNPEENQQPIYVPPRGSLARATLDMVQRDVMPLITKRAELWTLVEKLALYTRDYAEALSCAERAWRMASQGENWLQESNGWKAVVAATDNLVSAYENYGPQEKVNGDGEVEKGWKMKAKNAIRGTMGKAKDIWDSTQEWDLLKERLDELKSS